MKLKLTLIGCLIICQCCFAQHWQSLGLGLLPSTTTFMYSDTVTNLLYVSGQFSQVDGNGIRGIASWDGANWAPMADGIDSCSTCGTLPAATRAITRYGNDIYAGGGFEWIGDVGASYLAKWNGTSWDSISGGQPNSSVYDLIVYNNELYACGFFSTIGGISANGIAKWDGSTWSTIGNNYNFVSSGAVTEMEFYHGNLYVGGIFQDPQGNTCRLAKWDGSNWQFLTSALLGSVADVWDLTVYNDELYVSGLFYAGVGNNPANSIMRWNDTTWRDVGGSVEFYSHNVPQVRQMLVHNGRLWCSGSFEIVGGVFAFGLASWDGTNWCGYGTSFTQNSQECGTWNIEFFQDTLYIGGGFYIVEGDSIAGIAKWIGGAFVDSCGNTTGVDDANVVSTIQVFPNPANEVIHFSFSGGHEKRLLIIYDQLGREVWREETDENLVSIPVSEFSVGMFFYTINDAQLRSTTGKFVIEQ